MTSFAHQLAPANKSPTHKVNPCSRGNGQPAGQLDVGQVLSDVEREIHIEDCYAAEAIDACFFATMGELARARIGAANA